MPVILEPEEFELVAHRARPGYPGSGGELTKRRRESTRAVMGRASAPPLGRKLEGRQIVPVSLSVELDARGRVKSIAGDTPTPAAVTDIKTLRDSGQLTSTGEQQSTGGATHQIERDEQGRQVLRRKRFSIS
jgi:hypothetical protein